MDTYKAIYTWIRMAQYTDYLRNGKIQTTKWWNIFIFNDTHYETKHVKAFFIWLHTETWKQKNRAYTVRIRNLFSYVITSLSLSLIIGSSTKLNQTKPKIFSFKLFYFMFTVFLNPRDDRLQNPPAKSQANHQFKRIFHCWSVCS